jgi:hypothetical protein
MNIARTRIGTIKDKRDFVGMDPAYWYIPDGYDLYFNQLTRQYEFHRVDAKPDA